MSNYLQWFGSFCIAALVLSKYKSYPIEIRLVGFIGIFSFLFQFLGQISMSFWNNHYLNEIGDCYTFIETIFLLALYFHLFRNTWLRALLILSAIACGVIYIFLFTNVNYYWFSILSTLESILMIICSMILFFKIIRDLPEENLLTVPMFWINSAILLFFSCSFILSLTLDYLVNTLKDEFDLYWAFRNFLRVLFCTLICIGIRKARGAGDVLIKTP